MKHHSELPDDQFEREFAHSTMDPTLFSHEAHLRLAWIHINKYGINTAVDNVRQQLKRYVASIGAKEKYHETVTIAAVRAVYHFMLKSETNSFFDFIEENKQLLSHFKELLLSHYTTNIFESDTARKIYVEPELQAFD